MQNKSTDDKLVCTNVAYTFYILSSLKQYGKKIKLEKSDPLTNIF